MTLNKTIFLQVRDSAIGHPSIPAIHTKLWLMLSILYEFSSLPHIFFYQIQDIWFYVKIHNMFGVELVQHCTCSLFSFIYMQLFSLIAPFFEDAVCFPVYIFDFFIKTHVFLGMWSYIYITNPISLIKMCVFMPPLYHCEHINIICKGLERWLSD